MDRAAISSIVNHETDIFSQLQEFVERDGFITVSGIKRIRHGRNSQVFLIEEGNNKWVVKKYHQHAKDRRNRLENETLFLSYLKEIGVARVAEPIAVDVENNLGLFSYLPGVVPESINDDIVHQASEFIRAINEFRNQEEAKYLRDASDTSFSVISHLNLVKQRVNRLNQIVPSGPIQKEVLAFVRSSLVTSLDKIINDITNRYSDDELKQVLSHESRIISPSDFGVQNMLVENSTVHFLDFEYAGWDDPAKLICDFGCHPEIPVKNRYLQSFKDSFYSWLDDAEDSIHRSEILINLYRLRWCCIILNEFTAVGQERRAYAGEIKNYEKQYQKSKIYYERHLSWLT
jgi:thiamine kinase-like enzyme